MISTIEANFLPSTSNRGASIQVTRATDLSNYYYDYDYKISSLENSVNAVKKYIKRQDLQSEGGSWVGGYTATGYCFVHVTQTLHKRARNQETNINTVDNNIIVCLKDAI